MKGCKLIAVNPTNVRSRGIPAIIVWLSLFVLFCISPGTVLAQSQPAIPAQGAQAAQGTESNPPNAPGSISGTVVDGQGATVSGAQVKLTRGEQSLSQDTRTGDDGQFSFVGIAPGTFHVTITSEGFATQTISGTLHSGETYTVPQVPLSIAANVTQVVVVPPEVLAEEQVKQQEKQRVLGAIPNFYVTYVPNAVPLYPKQKFELAWKSMIDPVNLVLIGGIAGIQQATDQFPGYGQGAAGYGKRYGAVYGDFFTSTFIGDAILPSLFKQDPRYFYKGTGSTQSRILYAIANTFICKGDNGRWQFNYSYILGSLASGGISNAYYPEKSRGVGLVFENTAIGLGENAAVNLLQEFIIRKLTPNLPKIAKHDPSQP
jgi:hypothetical protein